MDPHGVRVPVPGRLTSAPHLACKWQDARFPAAAAEHGPDRRAAPFRFRHLGGTPGLGEELELHRREAVLVTRHGVPSGDLRPVDRRFVGRDLLCDALVSAPPVDTGRLRDEVDEVLDQSPQPRA